MQSATMVVSLSHFHQQEVLLGQGHLLLGDALMILPEVHATGSSQHSLWLPGFVPELVLCAVQ